ncbi:MAG: Tfp pilus tip-associated adhesin PilY1 [Desulforhopalus sp.]|jgi:Tfp pilus tip-associated adhesin PilY1
MIPKYPIFYTVVISALIGNLGQCTYGNAETAADYKGVPPFLSSDAPPLVMLVMGKNHKLYYEAYNDASDLNDDGTLDVGYKGAAEPFVDTNSDGLWNGADTFTDTNGNGVRDSGEPYSDVNLDGSYNDTSEGYTDINGDGQYNSGITYYGYFDSYKCYTYSSSINRFEPTSAPVDSTYGWPIKTCSGAAEWSGDFLNYLTMSRMDALRKVLYGGRRSIDTSTQTALRRVYVPQDAHSWGKEYASVTHDGYDIRDYSPLDLPSGSTRHLFASTTLSVDGDPILRVLPNNSHRIWEWVAKERPVADDSLETTGTSTYTDYPDDHIEYDALVSQFANASHIYGSGPVTEINGSGNPYGPDENYLNIFDGQINIGVAGVYEFAVDGDDAVEFLIDGTVVSAWYGDHGWNNGPMNAGTIVLTAGVHDIEFRHQETSGSDNYYLWWRGTTVGLSAPTTFEIAPSTAFVASSLTQSTYDVVLSNASTITDYVVEVEVCNATWPESNCKQYPSGNYKPTGLLQSYGESDRMYFGLMSGSYTNNTRGGVLRKNVKSIRDEIEYTTTGQFTSVSGIIDTINKFRISRFVYPGVGNYVYSRPDGGDAWVTTRAMVSGEFPDWGNPTGEMMYETLRYFAGKSSPTPDYDYSATDTSTVDYALGLPKVDWVNPYVLEDVDRDGTLDTGEDLNSNGELDGFESCSKPFMLVLSDIYPTYDSDHLPGSYFNTSFTGDLTYVDIAGVTQSLNVEDLADDISLEEGIGGSHYIGDNQGVFDGACTPKAVTGLGDIQGLCPEEPTKLGSYYSASVAYFGMQNDISQAADDEQRVATYAVGLASPLPKIHINAGGSEITLVPFGKSVGGSSISSAEGVFQPTNTIVDFFVEEITPTYGKFRINYEDVEQGADHDMDAIVEYTYQVNADNTVTINLDSVYAAGGIMQHLGYIISGTTADGAYLEVRDVDTAATSDPDYFLDTPPTTSTPGTGYNDGVALPLTASRTFTAGTATAATLLENPLWYAAKFGGFIDENTPTEDTNDNGGLDAGEDLNGNGVIDYLTPPVPDLVDEWDEDGDGDPDSYFYVVNALKLEEQLNKSFAAMLSRASSGTAASVISNSREGEGAVYQSIFYPTYESNVEELTWIGQVHSLFVDSNGNLREDTDADHTLDLYVESDENGDGTFDPNEDQNENGVIDTARDLIVQYTENGVYKYDDENENDIIDTEDTKLFTPDIPLWFDNGVLDTEDENGDGSLAAEDINCDGILNNPISEDINGNGSLDSGEDLNGNNALDYALNEDANLNGELDAGEDLNGDGRLNLPHTEETLHMDYDLDGTIDPLTIVDEDTNSNNILDQEDLNCNGILDFEDTDGDGVIDITETMTGPFEYSDIKFLWSASDFLNNNITFDPVTQRSYNSVNDQRHIVTFVDEDEDMIVDSGELVDFVSEDTVPVASLTDTSKIYPYLTLFPSFANEPSQVSSIRSAGLLSTFMQYQTKREINFIRGEDQDSLSVGSFTLAAMRNRKYESGNKLWRLGDVVHSTPTVVGAPSEGYHLLYRDTTYAEFLTKYQKRRSVVYVGGNDGMLHAFNGGFFNSTTKGFETTIEEPFIDTDGDGVHDASETFFDWDDNGTQNGTTAWALGSEIWAYVPYNLLPHLYWLTEQDYQHVYYMDMKPKIFDAKIFVDSSGTAIDSDHPHGWGTVMAVGMRLGGGSIRADMDKSDGTTFNSTKDRVMRSAIVLFDITNPEKEPKVLAEIAMDGMGYTTCYPAVIPMRSKSGFGSSTTFGGNDWYLVFGSGPAESDGSPGTGNSLTRAVSEQTGKVFILDLKSIVVDGEIRAVNDLSSITTVAAKAADNTLNWHFQEIEANTFISQPVTVDYDLDFNTDVSYFGTISGDHSSWGGKMRRLVFEDEPDSTKWHDFVDGSTTVSRSDNVMYDLTGVNQPITAPASIALDSVRASGGGRERWVFFGTGRFMVREDAANIDQQAYYGVKEPSALGTGFTWGEVPSANLLDTTFAEVYQDRTVENVAGVSNWTDLLVEINGASEGWMMEFPTLGERNIGGATLLGETLAFTSYLPSQDICNIEGESFLYALYYKTGTAHFTSIIGSSWDDTRGTESGEIEDSELRNRRSTSIGPGLAESPNIHTGGEDGSKAFIQTSTGAIMEIEQKNPGITKSGKTAWKERR